MSIVYSENIDIYFKDKKDEILCFTIDDLNNIYIGHQNSKISVILFLYRYGI